MDACALKARSLSFSPPVPLATEHEMKTKTEEYPVQSMSADCVVVVRAADANATAVVRTTRLANVR
jgi:hypothetical protein